MVKSKRSSALNVKRKNRAKVMKTIVQAVILLILGVILFDAIFDVRRYEEPDRTQWSQDQGFIALSYFGVGRTGTSKLVAKSQLDEQLGALYDQGYRTISQQDIVEFYSAGKPLPDKALFLSFEDGRNDSSLFAQPILEKYNYKATFLSYANKVGNSERKFLQPKDMLKMTKTGFWELGTNGYRLTYINIFDDEGRYIGVRDESALTDKEHVEYYNHYLMDFIRDENMIPVENRSEMEERIQGDYEKMESIYTESLGYVPSVYMIMHANALGQGMNRLVTDVNTANIHKLFSMHFNREGNVYNSVEHDLYDLTRVQPASFWSTNHLLMKIHKDTGQAMEFVAGSRDAAEKWTALSGAAEFKENQIIVTSPPAAEGRLYLNGSGELRDVHITAKLSGNVVGKQAVYARYNDTADEYVRVMLENNELHVDQKKAGQEPDRIFTQKLDPVLWSEEDLSFDKASVYTKEQTASGAVDDEEEYPVNIRHTRQIELVLQGNILKLNVDKKPLIEKLVIDSAVGSGGVALESQYNEQNEKDDIYDALFEDVEIWALEQAKNERDLVFSSVPTGMQKVTGTIKKAVDSAVNWAIETF